MRSAPHRRLATAIWRMRAEPTGSRKHAGRARLLRARALLAADAPLADVQAPLEQAQALARSSGHPPLLWSSAQELACLHARLGHEGEAAACRAEARATVEAVASSIGDPALKRSFLRAETVQRALAGA